MCLLDHILLYPTKAYLILSLIHQTRFDEGLHPETILNLKSIYLVQNLVKFMDFESMRNYRTITQLVYWNPRSYVY